MSSLIRNLLDDNPIQRRPRLDVIRRRQTLDEFRVLHPINASGALRRHAQMAAEIERQNALNSRPLHFTPQTRRAVYAERKAAA